MQEGPQKEPRARVVAFYLPQYHVVPENSAWWGADFTDWVNVRKAKPLFDGHYQPRTPLHGNYYDLTDLAVLRWQAELARSFALAGFCHYHYWFDGRQLLERPTDLVITHPEIDFPFCLAWANHSWSRRWMGGVARGQVLVRQRYSANPGAWRRHFEYLFRAWSDPRHLRVDGRPVFLIYSPHTIPNLEGMLACWRDLAAERGLPGLHFVAMQLFPFLHRGFLEHFDAVAESQPAHAMFAARGSEPGTVGARTAGLLRALPQSIAEPLGVLWQMFLRRPRFHQYDALWQYIVERPRGERLPVYPGGFVDWDNTARYGRRARIVRGANPRRFEFWFRQLVDSVADEPPDRRLIFLNAWNEWAEGAHLEPDERYGQGYLEAVRASVS